MIVNLGLSGGMVLRLMAFLLTLIAILDLLASAWSQRSDEIDVLRLSVTLDFSDSK